MKKHELSEENVVLESEAVEEQVAEQKPEKKPKKPARKLAKVIAYDPQFHSVAYEFDGIIYQSNCKEYDGVSEYIEI